MIDSRCGAEHDDERAAMYVAGRLDAAALELYEIHLLSCADCRASVQRAAELRAGLRRRRRRRRAGLLAMGGGGVAAAAIAWMTLRPNAIERLGRVDEAPPFLAMEVRASVDSSALFAARGVEAYRRANYDAAVGALRRASSERPQPGTAFLLGASFLMSSHPDSAITAFRRVDELGGAVYGPEAHFYSAKAWLQVGARDSALARLALVIRDAPPPLNRRARALLDSIEAAR